MTEGVAQLEPMLTKGELSAFFPMSVRTIERCMSQEMPHHRLFGKVAFRVSEVEPWLRQHGYLERRGEE